MGRDTWEDVDGGIAGDIFMPEKVPQGDCGHGTPTPG